MWCTILPWWNVLYDIALWERGLRYCPGGMLCTVLPWGSVVYNIAMRELWCTILFPGFRNNVNVIIWYGDCLLLYVLKVFHESGILMSNICDGAQLRFVRCV